MRLVGLDVRHLQRYPHSFSGGQRQRIGIARALALRPDLMHLRRAGLGARRLDPGADPEPAEGPAGASSASPILFISHNLAVVDYIADRIAVMCAGRLVELAPRNVLFRHPVHPYTKALLAAVPEPDPEAAVGLLDG